MPIPRTTVLAALLVGCAAPKVASSPREPEPTAPEGTGCAVTSDEVVSDPTALPSGFDFTAQSVLDSLVGSWSGNLLDAAASAGSAEPVYRPATLTLGPVPGGVVRALVREPRTPPPGSLGAAPVATCPPAYELSMAGTLASAPLLDEQVALTVEATSASSAVLTARPIPLAEVSGATRPSAALADSSLTFDATLSGATLQGSLAWTSSPGDCVSTAPAQVSCELPGSPGVYGCLDPSTGSCGACVGQACPAGVVEPVGSLTVSRGQP